MSPTGPEPPSSRSKRVSWADRISPPAVPFSWARFLHVPLAIVGAAGFDAARLPEYAVVTVLLTLLWPFCIRMADGVEIYFAVMWTSAAAAYLFGAVTLPIYWIAGFFGFLLIAELDARGIVRATGLAAESAWRYRGEPYALDSVADGDIRHSLALGEHAVRVLFTALVIAWAPMQLGLALLGETTVALVLRIVPVPGRMAPRETSARLATALGPLMPFATWLLHTLVVGALVLTYRSGGTMLFALGALASLVIHFVLKRLNDTRLESERRRAELVAMQDELDRRQRLATIGQTASMAFHQIARHHGAVGMYAHLLGRAPDADVREQAARIGTSIADANRVMNELLRFGQDRTLNLYPHALRAIVDECVTDVEAKARAAGVTVAATGDVREPLRVDKHKLKQAIVNLLDNAIEAMPGGGRVEINADRTLGCAHVTVRDHGPGVAAHVRDRLGTPFVTTKADGIGLGLALARELVEAHGGRLRWRDAAPGACFVLELPAR